MGERRVREKLDIASATINLHALYIATMLWCLPSANWFNSSYVTVPRKGQCSYSS